MKMRRSTSTPTVTETIDDLWEAAKQRAYTTKPEDLLAADELRTELTGTAEDLAGKADEIAGAIRRGDRHTVLPGLIGEAVALIIDHFVATFELARVTDGDADRVSGSDGGPEGADNALAAATAAAISAARIDGRDLVHEIRDIITPAAEDDEDGDL